MTGQHAFLAPSSAERWGPGRCPASPRLEAMYPEDEESPEAREGTAAHFYLSETLSGRTVRAGMLAPNGHPVDADMISACGGILADIRDTLMANPGACVRVEERVTMPETIHPQNWGTPDVYMLVPVRRVLHVWDFKYGHRYVSIFRNWQLLDYAAGILECNGVPLADWSSWTITTTIAQPRNFHPDGPLREHTYSGPEFVALVAELRAAAYAAVMPDAPMATGEHCRDCRARLACPALQAAAMSAVDYSLTGQPVNLPPAALGLELMLIRAAIKRLSARSTGLEEEALRMIRTGTDVPHWKGDYSYGRETWTLPVDQVVAMGAMYNIDLAKPGCLTPAQARAAGLDPDLVKALAEKPRGSLALVPFEASDAARHFGSMP